MHYMYIIKCADASLYTGSTNDLKKRILQHNISKSGAHYTKIRRPVVLVYSEQYKTLNVARKREVEIKKLSRGDKLSLLN